MVRDTQFTLHPSTFTLHPLTFTLSSSQASPRSERPSDPLWEVFSSTFWNSSSSRSFSRLWLKASGLCSGSPGVHIRTSEWAPTLPSRTASRRNGSRSLCGMFVSTELSQQLRQGYGHAALLLAPAPGKDQKDASMLLPTTIGQYWVAHVTRPGLGRHVLPGPRWEWRFYWSCWPGER